MSLGRSSRKSGDSDRRPSRASTPEGAASARRNPFQRAGAAAADAGEEAVDANETSVLADEYALMKRKVEIIRGRLSASNCSSASSGVAADKVSLMEEEMQLLRNLAEQELSRWQQQAEDEAVDAVEKGKQEAELLFQSVHVQTHVVQKTLQNALAAVARQAAHFGASQDDIDSKRRELVKVKESVETLGKELQTYRESAVEHEHYAGLLDAQILRYDEQLQALWEERRLQNDRTRQLLRSEEVEEHRLRKVAAAISLEPNVLLQRELAALQLRQQSCQKRAAAYAAEAKENRQHWQQLMQKLNSASEGEYAAAEARWRQQMSELRKRNNLELGMAGEEVGLLRELRAKLQGTLLALQPHGDAEGGLDTDIGSSQPGSAACDLVEDVELPDYQIQAVVAETAKMRDRWLASQTTLEELQKACDTSRRRLHAVSQKHGAEEVFAEQFAELHVRNADAEAASAQELALALVNEERESLPTAEDVMVSVVVICLCS
eukprot:TRINITY_DN27688_c0_g4_i1.p1 TRINITY_DN27688_c0_g4~~TRINITY_DN27688_c0_g4_i1.p1  ORF type:complete len:493 (-),score=129.24 TRINITY_DN27688_c0_g4_i1:61-1539(-)